MTFLGLKMIIFGHFSRFLVSFKISFSSLQHPTYNTVIDSYIDSDFDLDFDLDMMLNLDIIDALFGVNGRDFDLAGLIR